MLLNLPDLANVMRRDRRRKPVKCGFKPFRVINPTVPMHVANIRPRQPLHIVLSDPCLVASCCSQDAVFEVEIDSDYLVLDNISYNGLGQEIYAIVQKYDLDSWSEAGETYLGDIVVRIKNNNHENAKSCSFEESRVKVVLVDTMDRRITTVINPHGAEVKMKSHNLLEVVVSEESWNNFGEHGKLQSDGYDDDWKVEVKDYEIEQEGIYLKTIKNSVLYQTVSDPEAKVQDESILQRFKKVANPKLKEKVRQAVEKEITETKLPCREHHFFFTFSEESRKRINKLKGGCYRLAKVTLIGRCKKNPELCVTRDFTLHLSIHGKKKMPHTGLHVERKLELSKRVYDKSRSCLINPAHVEQIDFHVGYEEVVIEIAHPSLWWAGEPDHARWKIEVDDQFIALENLKLTDKGEFWRGGITFQRVAVEIEDKTEPPENKFLGAIKVIYVPRQSSHDGVKRISCWMEPHPGKTKKVIPVHSTGGKQEHFKLGRGWYKDGDKPERAKVHFEEVTGATLESGASTRKMTSIYVPPSYREDYEWGSGHAYVGLYQSAKKNGSVTTNQRGSQTSISQSNIEISTSSSATQKSIPNTTNEGKSGVVREPKVVYNPSHLQDIGVDEGTELIIRMSSPSALLNGKCEGEMWSVSEKTISDQKPTIKSHHIFKNDVKSFFQEIKISLDKNVSLSTGIHQAGGLSISCSESTRLVRLHVNQLNRHDSEVVWGLPPGVEFVEPQAKHEANDKRYYFVSNWQHNNAVIISENDVLYVKSPSVSDNWNPDNWSMQLVQHEIPIKVWEKLAQQNKAMMDRRKPWFVKYPPTHLTQTICLKDLNMQQPMIADVLNNLAHITNLDCFPIATLVFENNRHVENKVAATSLGDLEVNYKLKRVLHICADLKGRRKDRKTHNMVEPLGDSEIEVNPGDRLNITLRAEWLEPMRTGDGYKEVNWCPSTYPSFAPYKGTDSCSSQNVFKFDITNDAATLNEWLKFTCSCEGFKAKEKRIMIRVGC